MELTQLKYFCETAASLHVSRTAEKLHIAQPALTQSIRRLEEDLNVKLFLRRGRNIALTSCGEYFYKKVSPLLDELEKTSLELTKIQKRDEKTLHINVLAASALVTEAIIRYSEEQDVRFQLFQSVENENCDITVTTKAHSGEKREREAVIRERIYLAVSKDKFPKREKISLSEIEGEGFISLMGSRQFRAVCDKICRKAGILPKVIFESDNPTAVQNMIAAGMGVGFWPEFTWGDPSPARLLRVIDPPCSRDIVISHTGSKLSEEFFSYLVDFFLEKKRKA